MGALIEVKGRMPHPEGEIAVLFKRKGTTGLSAEIMLLGQVTGTFIWNNRVTALRGEVKQIITIQ